MAFQPPATALLASRAPPPLASRQTQREDLKAAANPKAAEDASSEPQDWILFPTAKSLLPHRSRLPSTTPKPNTHLSHFSDFGSLNSPLKSEDNAFAAPHPYETTLGSIADEETDELDSLVEGLSAFQSHLSVPHHLHNQDSDHIFPRHDGLGTFQDRLRHFERHNPLRSQQAQQHHQRRPSSVKRKLDDLKDEGEISSDLEGEKRDRIEAWRLEHSRILLDEIEKQTRQRKRSASFNSSGNDQKKEKEGEEERKQASGQNTSIPPSSNLHDAPKLEEKEDTSFLDRLTTRILHNLLGLDDSTLSLLFGETLPPPPPTSIPSTAQPLSSPFDPLTFLTHLAHLLLPALPPPPQALPPEPPLSYAGIPLAVTEPTSSRTHPPRWRDSSSPPPTTTPQHWGIEDSPPTPTSPPTQQQPTLLSLLRLHLLPPPSQQSPLHTQTPTYTRSSRAETIRKLHPLVHTRPRLQGRRWGSSCASQSMRTGGTSTTSAGSYAYNYQRGGGSSRCYWDIGGGGGWGEV